MLTCFQLKMVIITDVEDRYKKHTSYVFIPSLLQLTINNLPVRSKNHLNPHKEFTLMVTMLHWLLTKYYAELSELILT